MFFLAGSVHGAPTGNATPFDGLGLGVIGKKLEEYAYLCPGLFPWVNPGPATQESGMIRTYINPCHTTNNTFILGMHVTKLVGIMFVLIFFMDLLAAVNYSGSLASFIYTGLLFGIIGVLLVISRQPQNRYTYSFQLIFRWFTFHGKLP